MKKLALLTLATLSPTFVWASSPAVSGDDEFSQPLIITESSHETEGDATTTPTMDAESEEATPGIFSRGVLFIKGVWYEITATVEDTDVTPTIEEVVVVASAADAELAEESDDLVDEKGVQEDQATTK